jgi:peptide/nickel transport system substrate-binding protein
MLDPRGRHHRAKSYRGLITLAFALLAVGGAIAGFRSCGGWGIGRPEDRRSVRELVVSIRGEPRTFNRYVARDEISELVTSLTQAKLVRINHVTQNLEAWLAETWTKSDDGLRYTLKLRSDVTFSDGKPFTADDVIFSFDAVYDDRISSQLADALTVNGKKLHVAALDPLTVVVTFPSPFGPGLRLLDTLPIYPRHKLEAAFKAGTFARAWGLTSPVSEIAGLGPFVINDYQAGQRIILNRNAQYWRTDVSGSQLPYLDRITLEIVPDQNTEILRLEAGQIDMTANEVRPEDYLPLKRAADAGRVNLLDLGVGLDADGLWFNLKPGAFNADPRAAWLQSDELRRAVSMAVDRRGFADSVFLGAAIPIEGAETPANRHWYSTSATTTSYNPVRARALLASIGLTSAHPARFTLLTQNGNTARERGVAFIRDELKKIGVNVDVVKLDVSAVAERLHSGQYEAAYFGFIKSDTDPATNTDFWLSSGSMHVWNTEQTTPATSWERRIDELMARQIASTDEGERQRLYRDVQSVFTEHLPIVYFAAPRIYVATAARVTNLSPAVSRPQLLWNADTITVRGVGKHASN